VFLSRRPDEPLNEDLHRFYGTLLEAVNRKAFREGQWSLCERTGWPDNASFQNLVAWSWAHDDERYLIVVNLSDCPVQAQVQVRWADTGGRMLSPGLYVELAAWDYHFFQCLRTNNM
jgi:hypothetical protein